MKRAGKAHWLVIAGIASILVIAGLFFFGKDGAGETARNFMMALSKGDAQTLTDLSYVSETPKEELLKRWKFATEVSKHYLFIWRITGVTHTDSQTAAATMQVTRNPDGEGYVEKFELPLTKTDGSWKVDVRGINRSLYPALPR